MNMKRLLQLFALLLTVSAHAATAVAEGAEPGARGQDRGAELREALAFRADDPALAPLEDFSGIVLAALDRKQAEADKRLDTIRGQMKAALERAKDDAQKKGDLDAVLLYLEAIKNPDATPQTDNAFFVRLLAQRDAAKAKVEKWLRAEEAPIFASALQRLEQMKRDETKKGNIALAKAVDDYQESIRKLLGKPSPSPAAAPAKTAADSAPAAPSPSFGIGGPASERTISMSVDKPTGTGLGRFETGEILVVQYLSGTYKYRYSSSYAPTNPDTDERSDGTMFYYAPSERPRIEGPLRTKNVQTWSVPRGTAAKPFAIPIKDGGHYDFRVYGGPSWQGTLQYKVTKLSILQAKRLLASPEKDNYQWP